MLREYIQRTVYRKFTGESHFIMNNISPSVNDLQYKFHDINQMGIYLHVPFCNRICPYCPYNKDIFKEEVCHDYANAVIKEIDSYIPSIQNIPITSFYIGGGTPTTMLTKGIEAIINHIYRYLNMKCHVHMESHPNHLTADNLKIIESIGVRYLSVGVEALQDHHLRALKRPYNVSEVMNNVERAVSRNFDCVNVDLIFDLPRQTEFEIEQAGNSIIKLGVQQAATYPLFRFPYTSMGKEFRRSRNLVGTMFRRRRFLKILEDIFYDSGYYRSSVWAFTKNDVDKYCSVTVPLYLGFGASGSSYLKDIFYVNTFQVSEYIKAVNAGRFPIALSVKLSEEMQMAGWLYWRIYETKFRKSEMLGLLNNSSDRINLTDRGAYWLHALEDFFSIDYIGKLWGNAIRDPWPDKVALMAGSNTN
jgi:coproporphyrinogen III oxidase-like Fe-S oxidoreductase